MKTIIITFAAALVLGNVSLTTADRLPPRSTKGTILVLAHEMSIQYAVPYPLIRSIVSCESSFNPDATNISKREQSYGLSQINRLAHPSISIQQAEDPAFALRYLAEGLKSDPSQWSCYSKVKNGDKV